MSNPTNAKSNKADLIANMFAKAESTTPAEAEALMEAAYKLMSKYSIDQAVIDERRAKKGESSEKIVTEYLYFTGAYRGEMLNLCWNVVRGLGTLQGLQNTSGGKVFTFYLIGFESDIAQAKTLIASLQLQAAVAVRAFWKENKGAYLFSNSYEQEKGRRSFVHGFGTGVGAKLREARTEAVAEVSKGTELVLVSRKARVDEYYDGLSKGKGRARTATGRDGAAGQGFEAGKKANTGEKGVSQGRGISA